MGDPSGKLYQKMADGSLKAICYGGGGGSGGSATGDYIPEDGWVEIDDTLTYASATTFTVTGDLTATFQKGTKLKFTQTTVKYFYVTASAYVDPTTTVTITGGDDYTLVNAAIETPYYSYIENPQSFPDWFNYTPSFSCSGTMTISVTELSLAIFNVKGKTATVYVRAVFTLGGSASNTVYYSAPIESSWGHAPGGGSVYLSGAASEAAYAFLTTGTPDLISIRRTDGSNYTTGAARNFGVSAFYGI